MSHAPAIPDDVFEQIQVIDRTLAHAQAALAQSRTREMLEHLLKAQALSHSLMFRLEAERLPPGSCQPIVDNCTTPAQEQAVLL